MSVATPQTPRQRAGVADATALRGVAPGRLVPSGGSLPDCGGAPAASRAFWEQVTSGAIRLTKHEDQILSDGRYLGYSFDTIARAIMDRRARLAGNMGKAHQRAEFRRALRWRDQVRQERRA